jgi:MGT family glycosyltransferase
VSRILAYTSPARGHLFPLTPILLELSARGHEIVVRTLSAEVERAQALGFEASAIDPRIEQVEHDDYAAKNSRQAVTRAAAVFTRRAEFDSPDLTQAISEVQPDAVIVDFNCWGAMAAAEAWGGPWSAFCPYPTMLRSPDAPPFGPGFPPARGPAGRLRDKLAAPLVIGTVEKAFLPGVNAVRADVGLDALDHADDLVLAPPLMLYMTAEPFEYPRRDWPESFVMVGPCAWEPASTEPEWLSVMDKPIVLVTTSSEFQDDGELITTAFEALAGEAVEVVATAPAGAADSIDLPANGRIEQFVPHGQVLPKAVCAVTHGGMGATQKALAHGVPVCAVPFGRDQLEVARRVEASGAGTRLSSGKLSSTRLRAKVLEAIELKPGAERIAAAYEATGGANTAADAVEQRVLQT